MCYYCSPFYVLWDEQRTVAVAEEAEVVGEGVVVDAVPVVADEGAHQEEQGALRLVEVRYHAADDVILVARGDDDLRRGVQHLLAPLVHVAEQSSEGIRRGEGVVVFVGHPLRDVEERK